ncbi:HEAT repeat domain-containing protein [Inhella crocodyli]|uniref:HEAT repeat domain-containing protein n=1 Tax=Inhella crocodyli TaxID=2499851 RepID=A0A3S2XVI6_9BURK|nr:HEAT repeat domain-containing protein [Inhella crocodyli]RVT87562.1 HEAT repeat domain-containing protein [Inhella crocodyli]
MALRRPTSPLATSPEAGPTARGPSDFERLLHSSDATQRRLAAQSLGATPGAAPALVERLHLERDARVREALFTSVGRLPGADTVRALMPLLRSEDVSLRNGAIEALSGMPEWVAPHILQMLEDADPDVRVFTVNMMSDLRHAQVPDWLHRVLLHEPHVNVVAAALDVLAEVGRAQDLAAIERVRARFPDDPFIDFAATMAAQQIGSP